MLVDILREDTKNIKLEGLTTDTFKTYMETESLTEALNVVFGMLRMSAKSLSFTSNIFALATTDPHA